MRVIALLSVHRIEWISTLDTRPARSVELPGGGHLQFVRRARSITRQAGCDAQEALTQGLDAGRCDTVKVTHAVKAPRIYRLQRRKAFGPTVHTGAWDHRTELRFAETVVTDLMPVTNGHRDQCSL